VSEQAVEGFRAERAAILEIASTLNDDDWNTPSDCAGWAVRDVLAHLAATLHGVVDPSFMPDMSGGTENAMEGPVAERRPRPVADVLAEYEEFSAGAADAFAMLQAPGIGETPIDLNELGTHPMSALAGTFLFDSYTHLRVDMLRPVGPLDRPEPPRDEQRLQPTMEWMIAGMPWMCPSLSTIVDKPLVLALDGPGGGTFTIAPADETGRVVVTEASTADAAATVSSGTHDFVIWGTTRRPWRDYVKVDGDDAYAARVLDAVNIL
jgi:uncharacterized protein (TIGR03083 family)